MAAGDPGEFAGGDVQVTQQRGGEPGIAELAGDRMVGTDSDVGQAAAGSAGGAAGGHRDAGDQAGGQIVTGRVENGHLQVLAQQRVVNGHLQVLAQQRVVIGITAHLIGRFQDG